jgi:hypothetical protein
MDIMAISNALHHLRRCGALTRVTVAVTTIVRRGAFRGPRVVRGIGVAALRFVRGEYILVGQATNRVAQHIIVMAVHACHALKFYQ